MGSRIACHFANAGLEVLLLDLAPRSDPSGNSESLGKPSEEQTGRVSARNKTADEALQAAVRSSPSPLYKQQSLRLLKTGNFDDHMAGIASADWIIYDRTGVVEGTSVLVRVDPGGSRIYKKKITRQRYKEI